MGKRDILTKKYFSKPSRFADIFNAYIFGGREMVHATDLSDVDTAYTTVIPGKWSKSRKSYAKQKYRDLMRTAIIKQDRHTTYILLGIENQNSIHYAMPARNMLYNALAYDRHVAEIIAQHADENSVVDEDNYLSGFHKEDKLLPVMTLTVYWGDKEWDGPRKLSEMFTEHSKLLDKYIDDIDINLFSIIDDETYKKCKTEIKDVFYALHARNNVEKFRSIIETAPYQNLTKDDAEILSEFAGIKMPRKTRNGGYNMCKAVDKMQYEARLQEREVLVCDMYANGDISEEIAARNLHTSVDAFRVIFERYRSRRKHPSTPFVAIN